jgi:endonuclease YncB( thermonuclease family)
MPFVEDLDEFLSVDDFADAATYTPSGGSPATISGIFDGEYVEPLSTESAAPAFGCKASDVPSVADGDALHVRGEDYLVRTVQPDGQGWVVLKLELQ